jgi:hypothetical protein
MMHLMRPTVYATTGSNRKEFITRNLANGRPNTLLVPEVVSRNMLKSHWVVGRQRVCARGGREGVDLLHRLPRPRLKHAGH